MILSLRFVILLGVGAIAIGLSGLIAPLMVVGVAAIAFAAVGLIADWIALTRRTRLEVNRDCAEKMSLGAENLVKIRIRNSGYNRLRGMVRDEYPEDFIVSGNVIPINLAARSEIDLSYHAKPPRRGDFVFGDIYVRLAGPLGLAIRQIRFPMSRHVQVYPNLLDMSKYEIALKRASEIGTRSARAYGSGTEFESLRDYNPDDEFRAIDWKATARRGKLISRQYQVERSQSVIIALDRGRISGQVIEGLTRLDHSINAAMMLAHVATLRCDKVGLLSFAEDIDCFVPPKAGRSQTISLLRLTYDLHDAEGDSNYSRAFSYLNSRWPRRSFVIVFTDILDPESSKPLIAQVTGLARKHLVMVAAMADPEVIRAATSPAESADDAYRTASARQVIHARELAATQLTGAGAIVIDVPPDRFTPDIVDQYIEIKSRARI